MNVNELRIFTYGSSHLQFVRGWIHYTRKERKGNRCEELLELFRCPNQPSRQLLYGWSSTQVVRERFAFLSFFQVDHYINSCKNSKIACQDYKHIFQYKQGAEEGSGENSFLDTLVTFTHRLFPIDPKWSYFIIWRLSQPM